MTTLRLDITSFTCDHCARTIEEALNGLPKVRVKGFRNDTTAGIDAQRGLPPGRLIEVVGHDVAAPT